MLQKYQIFIDQPTGFIQDTNQVCQLQQALYSLKQAGMLWNKTLNKELVKIGFKPIIKDACIYRIPARNFYLMLYVNDTIITAPTKHNIKQIKEDLSHRFQLKEMGEPSRFLGCRLARDYNKSTITLAQDAYTKAFLASVDMSQCRSQPTPINPGYRTLVSNPEHLKNLEPYGDVNGYQGFTGKLNWISRKTRPDINYTVFRVLRRNSSPTIEDLKAVKNAMRFLRGSTDWGIILGAKKHHGLEAYIDASFQDHEDGKSTKAYIIIYAGAPIS